MDKKGEIEKLTNIIKPDLEHNNKYFICSYQKF